MPDSASDTHSIVEGTLRILLVSDLHYTLPQFDWVVRSAPSFDLVVLAGDHLDISSSVPLDAQSVVVLRYLSLLRSVGHVAVSSGNHDLTGPDDDGEQSALWLAWLLWPRSLWLSVHLLWGSSQAALLCTPNL